MSGWYCEFQALSLSYGSTVLIIINIVWLLDKTVKLWKISERCLRAEGFNLCDERGVGRTPAEVKQLRVPVLKPSELIVEASPRKVFANAHTYHINSISINSDDETYLSADDLRINLWHLGITNQSFSILLFQELPYLKLKLNWV